MSEAADSETPRLPFSSRADFLDHGMIDTTMDEPLDCSICREPLATATTSSHLPSSSLPQIDNNALPRVAICDNAEPPYTTQDHTAILNNANEAPNPEAPILIHPCSHMFGRTCLATYFRTTDSNRCPICNTTLFPARHIHLAFLEPTRAMRSDFADYIEHGLEDPEWASMLRYQLMGEWPRMLMRELAVEIWRSKGFEVSWEYVDVDVDEDGGGDGEKEDEDGSEEGESQDEDAKDQN
ncbi:hypothetical protein EK21DRAFT_105895 [Setomelanomma holmii]|uniref:RING-type domain-containing protein n=1 Tax=Setomelanomma holmii TaxID=210430 RepID=A0A9P4HN52_9PLEO|nr:hypothetical protein EK21DRAFT_105895 [Setomelanomma holmii]